MRRVSALHPVLAGVLLAALTTAPDGSSAGAEPASQPTARATLERAAAALHPTTAASADASLALRDLFLARPGLSGPDRLEADALLARPTDGSQDPYGDGYLMPAEQVCDQHFCLHWVPLTADAPPSADWVASTLALLGRVWRKEVGRLGYRPPLSDAGYADNGGNGKFDVYLKELGGRGLYGYCAPEHAAAKAPRTASGFCVLDNDFSPQQYGGARAEDSRAVTAAHEFFHAVQFAYDAAEDPWFMESTATWMEERFADRVDDNRQYLKAGQVAAPRTPLDLFDPDGFAQYGNWAWWEFLSEEFGTAIVRKTWQRAAAVPGAPREYSTQAMRHVLRRHAGLTRAYARFAAANVVPERSYREGSAWPAAPMDGQVVLSAARRTASASPQLDHLTSAHYRISPGAGLRRATTARIRVRAMSAASPAAAVLVRTASGWDGRSIPLRAGRGAVTVPFGSLRVRWVVVTLVNASTRFRCGKGDSEARYSCQGLPRDDDRGFRVAIEVRPG